MCNKITINQKSRLATIIIDMGAGGDASKALPFYRKILNFAMVEND